MNSLPTAMGERCGGIYRHKYRMRALCQAAAFLALIGVSLMYHGVTRYLPSYTSDTSAEIHSAATQEYSSEINVVHNSPNRRLIQSCDEIDKVDPAWLTAFMALGVLYMFLALAIVCDEFFVPALEEMSSKRHLNLSMDVAGATLMAAGGSAPELFSSLFGTFSESEIGFGTIIGSAVFNVLFVIAMCSIFAKELLSLTWWPLFRDSSVYAVGLIMLSIFVGVTSPERIELWEACVLFAMYFAYILIMWKNADIYKAITGKELEYPDEDETEGNEEAANGFQAEGDVERPANARDFSARSMASHADLGALTNQGHGNTDLIHGHPSHPTSFRWQGTFRAGILKLLRDPHSWVETGGVGIVARIAGDADYVFQQTDENNDGHIDKHELRKLFTKLDLHASDEELDEVFQELDKDGDGVINTHEFNEWYTTSKELIRSQVHHVFDHLDSDKNGLLDKGEIKVLLEELEPQVTDEDVAAAINAMYKEGSREEITFAEFSKWYEESIIYERQKKAVEEDMEGAWESLKPPSEGGFFSWVQYIVVLPLVAVMVFTIPDVRRPGLGKWCYAAFILSIAWIGAFSYLMVWWAEVIGNTFGIPSVIMGLTVLAAGTSVPDLLSSVIVARRGSGDMAVSSSVGSNIFDILVGLPIPWILYTAWPSKPSSIAIESGNIWAYILILLGMLVTVITAIHFQGWKLTKQLAVMMLIFYLAFLAVAIVLELPFTTCVP